MTVTDLERDCRWPHRTHTAVADIPIRSLLAVPVETVHHRGVLGLRAPGAAADSAATERAGRIWAPHAAIASSTARRREEQVRTALASRNTIGQAKSMLMQRDRIGADRAFQMVSAASQNTNIPVADLAACIAQTGADEIPSATEVHPSPGSAR